VRLDLGFLLWKAVKRPDGEPHREDLLMPAAGMPTLRNPRSVGQPVSWRYPAGARLGQPPVTTKTIEGYFFILKRGINGVYHHLGKQHLHRYLSEFDFRYNSRKGKDGDRTLPTLKGVDGKRLMLRDSTEREVQ